jgi:hypothetical protein
MTAVNISRRKAAVMIVAWEVPKIDTDQGNSANKASRFHIALPDIEL